MRTCHWVEEESVPRVVRDRGWTRGSRPRKRGGRWQRLDPHCTTRLGEVMRRVETLGGDGEGVACLKTISVTAVSKRGTEMSDGIEKGANAVYLECGTANNAFPTSVVDYTNFERPLAAKAFHLNVEPRVFEVKIRFDGGTSNIGGRKGG